MIFLEVFSSQELDHCDVKMLDILDEEDLARLEADEDVEPAGDQYPAEHLRGRDGGMG